MHRVMLSCAGIPSVPKLASRAIRGEKKSYEVHSSKHEIRHDRFQQRHVASRFAIVCARVTGAQVAYRFSVWAR